MMNLWIDVLCYLGSHWVSLKLQFWIVGQRVHTLPFHESHHWFLTLSIWGDHGSLFSLSVFFFYANVHLYLCTEWLDTDYSLLCLACFDGYWIYLFKDSLLLGAASFLGSRLCLNSRFTSPIVKVWSAAISKWERLQRGFPCNVGRQARYLCPGDLWNKSPKMCATEKPLWFAFG